MLRINANYHRYTESILESRGISSAAQVIAIVIPSTPHPSIAHQL